MTIEQQYEEDIRKANEIIKKRLEAAETKNKKAKQKGAELVDKDQEIEEVSLDSMTGRDAFFALMAIKMMNLSQQYGRKLDDLHDLFYSVSCDWDRLQ